MVKSCCHANRERYHTILISVYVMAVLLIMFGTANGQISTIYRSIPLPEGYRRIEHPINTFSGWVQTLPLKKDKIVYGFDRKPIMGGMYNIFAVVDLPLLFRSDIEQCADFCMRFWAEYHKQTNKLDQLSLFNYNGKQNAYRGSGRSYKEFLRWAFAYSNSHSLKKGCVQINSEQLRPGDMIVQNETGGVGHVSMIMDECKSSNGVKLYLIGFSFMPAQEFHIERASDEYGVHGWFRLEGFYKYLKDFINIGTPVLRRFPE